MNTRIKAVRKAAGLTLEKFGERIGISNSACSAIETGKNNPSEQTIRAICREFGVNELWLRYGDEGGAMYQPRSREEELGAYLNSMLADSPEAFRARLLTTLLRFDPDGAEWQVLERIYSSIAADAADAAEDEEKKDESESR